jgi:tripartite-type tricarboxylate transporter receptor subunit TctC
MHTTPSRLATPRRPTLRARSRALVRRIAAGGAGVLLACGAAVALAQAYPAKPIRMINVFPPGGSSDVMARLAAQKLSEQLGQPVVVENRPGAGGVTGNDYVAKQPADGYTLLLVTGAYPVQAAMLKSLPFDPLKDIQMISTMTSYPFVMNVTVNSPFRTVAEFIAFAKANPGRINYSTSGVGSVHHLASELFNAMAGTDMTHVPFKGGTAPMTELIAGRVDVLFEATTSSVPQIRAGKVRALAVTSKERWKAMPDVPTVHDTLPGYEVGSFIGVATTGGTPQAIVDRLNAEMRKAVAAPDVSQRLIDLGGEPKASSPAEMRAFVEKEIAQWRRVIELRKIERE